MLNFAHVIVYHTLVVYHHAQSKGRKREMEWNKRGGWGGGMLVGGEKERERMIEKEKGRGGRREREKGNTKRREREGIYLHGQHVREFLAKSCMHVCLYEVALYDSVHMCHSNTQLTR